MTGVVSISVIFKLAEGEPVLDRDLAGPPVFTEKAFEVFFAGSMAQPADVHTG